MRGKAEPFLSGQLDDGNGCFCVDRAQFTRNAVRLHPGLRQEDDRTQRCGSLPTRCWRGTGFELYGVDLRYPSAGDRWTLQLSNNLKSMFLTCKHVLPRMERQRTGAIVNIASFSDIRWLGVPYISYAATKAAVIQFTRVIALQYARSGIRANSILPGMMNTPMVHAPEVIAAYGGSVEEMVRRRDA